MSKKNGALFSRSLFGYRSKDVIEYIRTVDAAHADELARMTAEKDDLQLKLNDAEIVIEQTKELMNKELQLSEDKIKRLTSEYDKRIAELTSAMNLQKDKLLNSENRASSYLKLIDSSSMRAENAEAELTILSATIEDYKTQISDLKSKLSEKEDEVKRASEFETLAKKILESNNTKKQSDPSPIFSFFRKSRHNK